MLDPIEEVADDSDEQLYVSSGSDGEVNAVFAADPQRNNLNRQIVRLGLSYQELRDRPTYWTIEKQMALHNETRTRCEQLEADVLRLTEELEARKPPEQVDKSCNTDEEQQQLVPVQLSSIH